MGKKKIVCERCGYSWTTKSEMEYVCCPKCMKKVNINGTRRNNKNGNGIEIHNA